MYIKKHIVAIARWPVRLFLLAVVLLEWCLTTVRFFLTKIDIVLLGASTPVYLAENPAQEPPQEANDEYGESFDPQSACAFLEDIRLLDDQALNELRSDFENTRPGRRARLKSSDRRLYAVLIPTDVENLKRIINVLCEMCSEDLYKFCLKHKDLYKL